MATVIICWGEGEHPAKPLVTVPNSGPGDVNRAVDDAKNWCQAQANGLAGDVLPLMQWRHYLSRGTGPGTSHYVAKCPDGTFEIFIVGEIS